MHKPILIYHANCPDGTCSAAVAAYTVPGIELWPAAHGEPPPDVSGRDVLICDFSYSRPVLDEMLLDASSLLVLDHHATAQDALAGSWSKVALEASPIGPIWDVAYPTTPRSWLSEPDLGPHERGHLTALWENHLPGTTPPWLPFPAAIFDMERSGAGMAWDHFHPDEPRPWIVRYVEDGDLWQFALPASKVLRGYIMGLPHDDMEPWIKHLGQTDPPVYATQIGDLSSGSRRHIASVWPGTPNRDLSVDIRYQSSMPRLRWSPNSSISLLPDNPLRRAGSGPLMGGMHIA